MAIEGVAIDSRKQSPNPDAGVTSKPIKSVILYEGSITNFGSRLHGFNIGTCLEVIEHMDESQAYLFRDVALSCFRPRILIISIPKFEYNCSPEKIKPNHMTVSIPKTKNQKRLLLYDTLVQQCKSDEESVVVIARELGC